MIDFISYVVQEFKAKRLSKTSAAALVQQYSAKAGSISALHPLLHANTSDLEQQSYTSRFDGREFFLDDHRVGHGEDAQKVLPGVAYLEMARAAVNQALPQLHGTVVLSDVVWLQPIVVDKPTNVVIALFAGEQDLVEFEIYSSSGDEEVVHCRGGAIINEAALPEPLDIAAIKAQMNQGELSAAQIYPAYRQMGVDFGPAHRGVVKVFQGHEQLLAQLQLPQSVDSGFGEFVLHPSLIDSALQAAVGFLGDLSDLPPRPSLPFALESIDVYGPCPKNPYVFIRHSAQSKAGDRITKLDIDLADANGNICVSLKGFASRELSNDLQGGEGTLLTKPEWLPAEVAGDTETFAHKAVLLATKSAKGVDSKLKGEQLVEIKGDDYIDIAGEALAAVQRLLSAKHQGPVLLRLVVPGDGQLLGLGGLLKTAALENPSLSVQLIASDAEGAALGEQLSTLYREDTLRFDNNQALARRWVDAAFDNAPIAFQENGVYLITGGLGGLGVIFADEILSKTQHGKVVLTGRAAQSALGQKADILKRLAADNRVEYRQLDLTDGAAVSALLADIIARHGRLNGILHSAGMNADSFIVNKTPEQLAAVFAPKVTGCRALDEASKNIALDFMALFSSGAAILGNPGQSDYAMANGFMDVFANRRNAQVEQGQRQGVTLSVNWPLWQDGGMSVDQATADRFYAATGMQPMPTDAGIDAFYQSLQLGVSQTLVMQGAVKRLRDSLNSPALAAPQVAEPVVAEPAPQPVAAVAKPSGGNLEEQTRDFLRKELSGLLKLPAGKIDPQAPLERYGIDSILTMDLTNKLEKSFGSLSKTLFFEYQTIAELTEYFIGNHADVLTKLFAVDSQSAPAPVAAKPAAAEKAAPVALPSGSRKRPGRRFGRAAQVTTENSRFQAEPIAIVGLSGRYPQGWDIDAFWQNLKNGKDCVTEVPKERWDWQEYYSEDRNQSGCHYSKWGGFIEGVDEFDPLFFNIVPVGAEYLDPQERLFLQHAWMAIEDAGFTRARMQIPHEGDLNGQVGVYAGVMYGEYQLFGAEMSLKGNRVGFAANPSGIANRVSYVLNLHGPSMTVDTMCSSSLTAIHIACEDLKQGRTDLALAGGVNISVHPNKYLMISAGQFISSEGQCQSFGEGGDGYIPAEGVGVAVLQRLSEAEAGGQHIYGIIKGSALSHGGKTNGYTVPNPQAQSSAIRRALKAADVDPRHVSYIEAHGTGTKLGDPIEIAALTQAFKQDDTGYCLIGSAKSNVGHCEAAAGIAGLTKVLLQMQYGKVVPSLHSQKLNPHIDFDRTPFIVNQKLTDWHRPNIDGKEIPRIAGISSFGAGGSNAHLVIEEYRGARVEPRIDNVSVVVPLSARTEEQLHRKAQELQNFITGNTVDLPSLAYTLQLGREAMDERLGILAGSLSELQQKLAYYLGGDVNIDGVHTGQVRRSKDEMMLINQDEDMKAAVDNWIARSKLDKLVELWSKGLELDWNKLYSGDKPTFISLPTYPFARDRYWVEVEAGGPVGSGKSTAALHPLLHVNTSDLTQQSYSTLLTGDEFFLRDHQVKQQKMLPAVAFLEMVRAAVREALPHAQAQVGIEMRNVVWAQPIVVARPKQVHVALSAIDQNTLEFEVYSTVAEGHPQDVIHAQGQVRLVSEERAKPLDLDLLQAKMDQGKPDPQQLYQAFTRMGIDYGPAYRAIDGLNKGDNQLLAHLDLPGSLSAQLEQFVLHPSLLDSALHASMGLSDDLSQPPSEPPLPFALDAIRIFAPCQSQMYAWVRFSEGSGPQDVIVKLDIDLCDVDGNVCIQMRGFTSRELSAEEKGQSALLLAEPTWHSEAASAPNDAKRIVILCGEREFEIERLLALLPDSRCYAVKSDDDRYGDYAEIALNKVQKALSSGELVQLVVLPCAEQAVYAGLAGLMKTAAREKPDFRGQVILSDSADVEVLAQRLRSETDESLVRYHNGERQVVRWQSMASNDAPVAFKDNGVYVITGGLGGLGILFCREILEKAPSATVVLTGRGELDAPKRAQLDALGGNVVYRAVDLSSLDAVGALFADVAKQYGKVSGVLHSAGMVADNLLANKSIEEFKAVLAPKVAATRHIDQATKDMALDFVVLFSSVSGAMGNVGQADYAVANGFMDNFAQLRNAQVTEGTRQGRTVSINWPLWLEGGMQLDNAALERMEQATGAVAMQTQSGMSAFYQALASQRSQVLVMEGDVKRLLATLQPSRSAPAQKAATPVAVADSKVLPKARQYLTALLAELLKMPSHEIDADAALEDYGIDSILAMNLTHQLEQRFGSLSKTLFFEYQTLNQLAGYFAKSHAGHFTSEAPQPAKVVEPAQSTLVKRQLTSTIRDKGRFLSGSPAKAQEQQVAIVGLAGTYPGADDLDAFWDNLKSGVDSVSEIPPERWDHDRFFVTERNVPGTSYSKWGGFINDVDKFDALFFNISPNEAKLIDPQERLFLQTAWHVLEDAGYGKTGLSGRKVGVYVGVMYGQYELYGAESILSGQNVITTSSYASIANRVSYYFDFRGPSMALDTMCSSSLTALHLAAQAVARGELDAAIAGGVNVTVHPHKYLNLSQGNFVASDGRCRSFGAGGDGYVPGEGVGAVLLKPLNDALGDGDHIYARLLASSLNHGGKTNGYTVPNPNAQGELILEALNQANIDPTTLGYIETHGTGTSLGDPIEITGLNKAFEGFADGKGLCPIGSVKSNIGHLESAAGIAALTKVLLQIKHGELVPSLHAETLNPNIDFDQTPFFVQRSLGEFKRPSENPRRAGISSFGAGGSNAHVIVEEFVDTRTATPQQDGEQAFILSAVNAERLNAQARNLVAWLEHHQNVNLTDLAYTLQLGRTAFNERLVLLADSAEQLKAGLASWLESHSGGRHLYQGNVRKSGTNAGALIAGEAGELFLKNVMDNRDLERIAQLWTAGVNIDWAALYGSLQPKRLSLPTYPFAKERHWVEPLENIALPAAKPRVQKQLVHYAPVWKAQTLGQATTVGGTTWLAGEHERYALDGIEVAAAPTQKAWLDCVAANLDKLPSQIVYIAAGQGAEDFYHLTYLVQALMANKAAGQLNILCVAADGAPAQNALAALLKTMHLENPNCHARLLVAPTQAQLDAELAVAAAGAEVVRYHDGNRQLQQLDALKPGKLGEAPLKQRGVYLVTGGLGGLGLIFARYLAQQYQARLMLLGRSALDDGGREKIAALQSLGAEVAYEPTDVTDAEQIKAVVDGAVKRFGTLNGVIHSAGVNDDALIINKTPEQLAKVLGAKVQGTLNLDAATQDIDLDIFVLFSSVAGAMGNPGQCDYAYANAFMDAFAAQRDAGHNGKTLSINWPLWAEGGMQLSAEDIARTEQHTGLSPLPLEQGIASLVELLSFEGAQALSLFGDSSKIRQYFTGQKVAAPAATVKVTKTVTRPGKDLQAATFDYLKQLVSVQTGLTADRIDISEPFESFGLDSMMISRFNTQLETDLGALPKTLLYEYESIDALAGYLLSSANAPLTALLGGGEVSEEVEVEVEVEQPAETVSAAVQAAPVATTSVMPVGKTFEAPKAIAIIGLDGRYPQSDDLDSYWNNLKQGKDMVEVVPADRWDADGYFDPDPAAAVKGRIYSKWGGFVADVDKFDPEFFNIGELDAELMDPQERLFLQSAWAVVEDAGYTRDSLKALHPKAGQGKAQSADVGVFVGVTTNTYQMLSKEAAGDMLTPASMPWSIANRVSYSLNLQGPSMPIDTACSSSLVALHLACESIRSKECQLAIAGGVNLYLHQYKYQSLCTRQMLAKGPKTCSFGADGDGFVASEGVGSVLLKPLQSALDARDHVYGVIAGSAYGHSGRANGYSAPNPVAQGQVLREALANAGVTAEGINYIEAHGTGTQLGDSLEVSAISQAFGKELPKNFRCPIGSVKANIGHGESAAGIAGLSKILLQMRHGQLTPSIHCDPVNPNIDFANAPIRLQRKLSPWRAPKNDVRRAMLNSFGAGGVNACVVIEQAPELPSLAADKAPKLIVLSAKSADRLDAYVDKMLAFIGNQQYLDLAAFAYTLQVGREAMNERLAFVAADRAELVARFKQYRAEGEAKGLLRSSLDPRKLRTGPAPEQQSEDLNELAALWCEGKAVNFDALYAQLPGRVSLPTYPFARKRYWVSQPVAEPVAVQHSTAASHSAPATLHPLVGQNASTLKSVSFVSELNASDYYAADHKINGQPLFPGAGMVEMACISGTIAGEQRVVSLTDIVWIKPLPFAGEQLQTRVFLKTIGESTEVEITSLDEDYEPVVHFQGQLQFAESGRLPAAPSSRDLKALMDNAEKTLDGGELYSKYNQLGFSYGQSFRTVRQLHCHKEYALASLSLDNSRRGDFEDYILHPTLLDGALQSVFGLVLGQGSDSPSLPFALDELLIYRPLTSKCYAYVSFAEAPEQSRGGMSKFNIELLDENGMVLASLKHFYVRALPTAAASKSNA